MSEEVKLDWSSAEVQDGTLTVALEGVPDKAWRNAFARTTALLNGGAWGEVKLKKGKVSVQAIRPGDEDRVRQFLEGVVLQANTDVETPDDEHDERPADPDAGENDAGRTPEDQEMTERLRAFAEPRTD